MLFLMEKNALLLAVTSKRAIIIAVPPFFGKMTLSLQLTIIISGLVNERHYVFAYVSTKIPPRPFFDTDI